MRPGLSKCPAATIHLVDVGVAYRATPTRKLLVVVVAAMVATALTTARR